MDKTIGRPPRLWQWQGKRVRINTYETVKAFLNSAAPLKRTTSRETYQFVENTWKILEDSDLSNALNDFILEMTELEEEETRFAVTSELRTALLDEMVKQLNRMLAQTPVSPRLPPTMIAAQNVLLDFNSKTGFFATLNYSTEVFAPSRLTVPFIPDATCPEFLEKLEENVPDPDNRRVIQEMLGVALLSENHTRKFLFFQGEGSTGKSFLINIVRRILGNARFFDLSNISNLHDTFELSALKTQTFLYASEATSGALCSVGSEMVKKMVGGDFFESHLKFKNERNAHMGYYFLAIVTNNKVRVVFEGKGDEWRDRMIVILFIHHIDKKDSSLENRLIANEGSGILNWMLEGAARVLKRNWEITLTPAQEALRDRVIANSHSVELFVRKFVEPMNSEYFTSSEALELYNGLREKTGFQYFTDTKFFQELKRVMSDIFGATATNNLCGGKVRGYSGYHLNRDF